MSELKHTRRHSERPAPSDVSAIDEATGLWLGARLAPTRALREAPSAELGAAKANPEVCGKS